jgi:hypothetical protein
MSDPTPTDVLIDQLRTIADAPDGAALARQAGAVTIAARKAADALTALRLDVQRITEERDEARSAFAEVSGWFPSTSLMREVFTDEQLAVVAVALDTWNPHSAGPRWARLLTLRSRMSDPWPVATRDAQVREAFLAGRFGRALPSGWTFTEPEYAHNADEAFAAYLRERQDGKEHAK